jgi:hypothetical protein
MNDRELLEAAAKAAGMDIEWQPCGWAHDNNTGCEWNPLTDDGDAFRLSVKLQIDVNHYYVEVQATRYDILVYELFSEHKSDPYAATRRAIVRAAAEIGKGMAPKVSTDDLPEDNYYKTQAEAEELGRSMK